MDQVRDRHKVPDIPSDLTAAAVWFLPCKAQSCRGQGRVAHAPTSRRATGVTPGNKQIKPLERANGRAEEVNNMSPALRCLAVSSLLSSQTRALRREPVSVQMCQIKGHHVCGPHGDSLEEEKNLPAKDWRTDAGMRLVCEMSLHRD